MSAELEQVDMANLEPQATETPREFTDVERQAMAQGWKPKEEFKGNPEDHISAAQFMRVGSIIEKARSGDKEIKELKKTLDFLAKHVKEEKEHAYERALQQLKMERDTAIEVGDKYRVHDLDRQISEFKKPNFEESQPVISDDEAVKQFVQKNGDWFNTKTLTNTALMQEAIEFEQKLDPSIPTTERLQKVEEYMAKKRTTPKENVLGSTTEARPTKSGKKSFNHLDAVQKQICKQLVNMGTFKTEQEYVDALVAQGDL